MERKINHLLFVDFGDLAEVGQSPISPGCLVWVLSRPRLRGIDQELDLRQSDVYEI